MPILNRASTPPRPRPALGLALVLASAGSLAWADGYLLAPGDVLRIDVAGIDRFSASAEVANDGSVSLPRFGRIEAAGLTVEQVLETVRERAGSMAFRTFDGMGAASYLDIKPDDMFLKVESYREVSVLGTVERPGTVPFRSGITVRSAIAAAGGVFRQEGSEAAVDLPNLASRLAKIGQLTRARAETIAIIWRIEASLGIRRPAPGAAELGLDSEIANRLVALQTQILATAAEDHNQALDELSKLDLISERRTRILEQQQENQAALVKAETRNWPGCGTSVSVAS